MPSAPAALKKYKRLFRKLGDPEDSVKLRIVTLPLSVHTPPTISDISLYKPIIDDIEDRRTFGINIDMDVKIFNIWGGALDVDGRLSVVQPLIEAAMQPGGGILYYGKLLSILDYKRGFSMDFPTQNRVIVLEWFLITEAIRVQK